jgi:hypothetical protein
MDYKGNMMIKYREYQAWIYLSLLWSMAGEKRNLGYFRPYILIGRERCHGICEAISALHCNNLIDLHAYQCMMEKMNKHPLFNGSYFWPLTQIGAFRRCKLCLQYAQDVLLDEAAV